MNIKALIKALLQRRFLTFLLLLQLSLTLGLIVNSITLALDAREKLLEKTGLPLNKLLVIDYIPTSSSFKDKDFYRSIIGEDLLRLSELEGVNSVAPMNQVPLGGDGWNSNFQDQDTTPEDLPSDPQLDYVSLYFSTAQAISTLELEIVEGRNLTPLDENNKDENDQPNIVISESLAQAVYGDESAIGKLSNQGRVVGVVADMLETPGNKPFFTFRASPITSDSYTQHYVLNVTPSALDSLRARVKGVLLDVNQERDILDIYSMKELHERFFANDKGLANLFVMLCILMLIVTAVSSFAHAQFHIGKQKKYIGIRRALGASRSNIMLYVLSESWLMNLFAGVIGIAFVIGFNILLSQQIEVSKPTVSLYSLAFTIIWLSSTLATWWPARQTSLIPPVIATRTI